MYARTASCWLLGLALVAGAAGCPKPRTSAATQPTPAAFVPAQSDPKAIEAADAGLAALGGSANWEKLKELSFTIEYRDGTEVKATFQHSWDRWNGRHYFVTPIGSTLGGKPEDVQYQEVKYDLYDQDAKPWAASGGQIAAMRKDADELAKVARDRLADDLYFIAIFYKMKDPGVKLAVDNAQVTIAGSTHCQPSCTSIKITFDPAVGDETWYVNFNSDSKLPEVIELQKGGGRIGYGIVGWTDAGGLKWPTQLQNLGLKTEMIEFSDIAVGDPEESTYLPTLQ